MFIVTELLQVHKTSNVSPCSFSVKNVTFKYLFVTSNHETESLTDETSWYA